MHFLSSALHFPKWFLTLAGERIEVKQAHRIGPEHAIGGPRCTIIFKVLCFTERHRILKAAREFPFIHQRPTICFSADYRVIEEVRKQGYKLHSTTPSSNSPLDQRCTLLKPVKRPKIFWIQNIYF